MKALRTIGCVIAALAVGALAPATAEACTAFRLGSGGQAVVGRSLDWRSGEGLVTANPRGLSKSALLFGGHDSKARWTSRYASVTLNQYGLELPSDGMNEAGLVVTILNLRDSVFPPEDRRPTVNALQFVQYLLDQYATLDEALAGARGVRITGLRGNGAIHYFVCDRDGACAAIELLGGEMKVTRGADLVVPTLTNDTYAASARFLSEHQGHGGTRPIPEGTDSLSRFARASFLAHAAETPTPEAAFRVLDSVRLDSTQWQVVYLPSQRRIVFRTRDSAQPRSVDVSRLARGCAAPTLTLDVNVRRSGDVTRLFRPYEADAMGRVVRSAVRASAVGTEAMVSRVLRYPDTLRCVKPGSTGD